MESRDAIVKTIASWLGTGSINIFGVPFAGKDTQGKRLAELLGAPLIGGGDIIRHGKDIPRHVNEDVNKGLLAPTEEYKQIITPYFSKPELSGRPLILSSVGRWHGEEETIIKAAGDSGHPLKAVIFLNINEEDAQDRWQKAQATQDRGQRADDKAEFVSTRVTEFRNKTLPVIDFYRQTGLLIELDGSGPPDEITDAIIEKLYKKAAQSSDQS